MMIAEKPYQGVQRAVLLIQDENDKQNHPGWDDQNHPALRAPGPAFRGAGPPDPESGGESFESVTLVGARKNHPGLRPPLLN